MHWPWRWAIFQGSLTASQTITTQFCQGPSDALDEGVGPGPWTDPMRRAGNVLEG